VTTTKGWSLPKSSFAMTTNPSIGRRGWATSQQQYYNSSLAHQPYCRWSIHLGLHANTR
jgi:hypothetical protein